MKEKMKKKVATENAEVRMIEWYEENLAKAEKEWSEIAQSYGAEDYQLVDLGFGDWVVLNMDAECQETICEADGDFETITDKQDCDRLTYLNNVIDGWSKKIREIKEAQEEISKIGRLINDAKDELTKFIDDLCDDCLFNLSNENKCRELMLTVENTVDDVFYDDENIVLYHREIKPLGRLCRTLNIETPSFCDVFVLKPLHKESKYEVAMVKKGEFQSCFPYTNDDEGKYLISGFIDGWVSSCANSVIQQAQERIGNLLQTGF